MRDTDVQREINHMSRRYDDDDIQEYARPWRPLTDEELLQAYGWLGAPMPEFIVEQAKQQLLGALRKVEAKLKEKNHG